NCPDRPDQRLQTLLNLLPSQQSPPSVPLLHCRIGSLPELTQMQDLKARMLGRLVSVRGTVIRVGAVRAVCRRLAFQCEACATVCVLALDESGRFAAPAQCSGGCRSRTFRPVRASPLTRTADAQTLRLQETTVDDQASGRPIRESSGWWRISMISMADWRGGGLERRVNREQRTGEAGASGSSADRGINRNHARLWSTRRQGRVPRTLECEVSHDLVDSCAPGDTVTVTGVVAARAAAEDRCVLNVMLRVCALHSDQQRRSAPGDAMVDSEFTVKELYAIEAMHSLPNVFSTLVASLCPAIFGHESVKSGLLLALFGGSQRGGELGVRSESHVLVVGDPGLGKSQMLQAVASVAPRSVYVCGNTSSTAGLTISLSKDRGSNESGLEAGALVLADRGVCCIDEFDKMAKQHAALLEAMEQQSVSIAKAGVVCSLPARCSVVAVANPVGGHFDRARTVGENLRMSAALLSRFDLAFILVDRPDRRLDGLLSEHVMSLHSRAGSSAGSSVGGVSAAMAAAAGGNPVPHALMRKYIAYARKYVQPRLTREAAAELQKFYLELRAGLRCRDACPVTTRQLESLVRLTEARARAELRELCTAEDARCAIQLTRDCVRDLLSDDTGAVDVSRSSGVSCRSAAKRLLQRLQRAAEQRQNRLFSSEELMQHVRSLGVSTDATALLQALNSQGFLLQKGPRLYQLQSYDF
uniref:DNA helicase n=1 Tax=Macrostomum lignano TaxID=282301 RepID=A0A1I8H8K6_9PLAT